MARKRSFAPDCSDRQLLPNLMPKAAGQQTTPEPPFVVGWGKMAALDPFSDIIAAPNGSQLAV